MFLEFIGRGKLEALEMMSLLFVKSGDPFDINFVFDFCFCVLWKYMEKKNEE